MFCDCCLSATPADVLTPQSTGLVRVSTQGHLFELVAHGWRATAAYVLDFVTPTVLCYRRAVDNFCSSFFHAVFRLFAADFVVFEVRAGVDVNDTCDLVVLVDEFGIPGIDDVITVTLVDDALFTAAVFRLHLALTRDLLTFGF